VTCAITRSCCQTADHGPDCRCWRCIAVVLDSELDAMQWAAALPEVKPAAKPSPKPKREAPEATLEALRQSYRTRGIGAFSELRNKLRLAELSPEQRTVLREWVARNKQAVPA
jgi:hypothetical protein